MAATGTSPESRGARYPMSPAPDGSSPGVVDDAALAMFGGLGIGGLQLAIGSSMGESLGGGGDVAQWT